MKEQRVTRVDQDGVGGAGIVPVTVFRVTTTVELDNVNTDYDDVSGTEINFSQVFSTSGFERFRLALQITKTGTPTDLVLAAYTHETLGSLDVEKIEEDFWADVRFSAAAVGAGTRAPALGGWATAPFMQFSIVGYGVSAVNYFTVAEARVYLI